MVIVGNKSDLEEDRAVHRNRAISLSQKWGRVPFYETSARKRQNVDEVFLDLCRQMMMADVTAASALASEKVVHPPKRKKRFCVIL